MKYMYQNTAFRIVINTGMYRYPSVSVHDVRKDKIYIFVKKKKFKKIEHTNLQNLKFMQTCIMNEMNF